MFDSEVCPNCYESGLVLKNKAEFIRNGKKVPSVLVETFECSFCKEIVAKYWNIQSNNRGYNLISEFPTKNRITKFDPIINNTYQEFVKIYNESETAENYGLMKICGPGYRKALEFLVKTILL